MTPMQSNGEHIDTTFITMWLDKSGGSYCSVQYDVLNESLGFTEIESTGQNFSSRQYSPINTSDPNNILSWLHPGLPLDSAKSLTKDVGWVCDSEMSYAELISLQFRAAHLAKIDNSFVALLQFRRGRLAGFTLNENPTSFSNPSSRSTHYLKDYTQLVAVLQSIYGRPHNSGMTTTPLLNSPDRVDSVYLTTWLDESNYYSVQYNESNSDLKFTALFLGKD